MHSFSTYVQLSTAYSVSQRLASAQEWLSARQKNMEQNASTPYVGCFAMRPIEGYFGAHVKWIS